jgi:hypothetical protein
MGNTFAEAMPSASNEEGQVAKTIEQQTSKLPSDVFLWAAMGSMAASATLKICGRKHDALFVGQWAAPFLLFGIYNKIVKIAGHDGGSDGGAEAAQKAENDSGI